MSSMRASAALLSAPISPGTSCRNIDAFLSGNVSVSRDYASLKEDWPSQGASPPALLGEAGQRSALDKRTGQQAQGRFVPVTL